MGVMNCKNFNYITRENGRIELARAFSFCLFEIVFVVKPWATSNMMNACTS